MPHQVHQIPLADIDAAALPRDRTGLDAEPQAELERSLAATGLRQPIEVFETAGTHPYGLLSGYRRLLAYRTLHERHPDAGWSTIPAFLRTRTDLAASLAAMVEENEIRAPLSPFERGLICVTARNQGAFATLDEAVEKLYSTTNAVKRHRLRTLAFFAEQMTGYLTAPEKLSQDRALRLARAISSGFGELLRTALDESSIADPDHQWELMKPILAEAEEHARKPERSTATGRPRRILRPRYGLTIRRERTHDGWSLHFTGREATGAMMDLVLDEIERMYAPG